MKCEMIIDFKPNRTLPIKKKYQDLADNFDCAFWYFTLQLLEAVMLLCKKRKYDMYKNDLVF